MGTPAGRPAEERKLETYYRRLVLEPQGAESAQVSPGMSLPSANHLVPGKVCRADSDTGIARYVPP